MLPRKKPARRHPVALASLLRAEWLLPISLASSFAFYRWGDSIFESLDHPPGRVIVFVWLFGVILGSALTVVRHAEVLAERFGEPYGTLILTLSVTFIEVMSISAVMLHGDNNPTLVRDTLLAVVMIILNGMVGLSLLVGAWRHREQSYNLQGANAYLSAVVPLVVLSLVLPTFTVTTKGPTLSNAQQALSCWPPSASTPSFWRCRPDAIAVISPLPRIWGRRSPARRGRRPLPGPSSCWAPIWPPWSSWPKNWPIP